MSEIAQHTLPREFRRIDPTQHPRDPARGLAAHPRRVRAEAVGAARATQLERLGVDVRTGSKVTAIDADGVDLRERATAAARDRADRRAHRDLGRRRRRLAARRRARARHRRRARPRRPRRRRARPEPARPSRDLGRSATSPPRRATGRRGPTPVPGVSPAAKQMGRAAAANILRRLRGEPTLAVPLPRLRQPGDGRPQGGDRRARRARPRRAALQRPRRPGCSGCSPTSTS